MPQTIRWYIPNRVIYMHSQGDLTLDDLEAVSNDIVELMNQGYAPVHLIVDDQSVGHMPSNLGRVQERLDFMRHPTLGWIIGIGEVNPILNFVIPMVAKMIRVNFSRRKTLEEAQAFLKRNDMTLDWSHAQPLPPF